jgi:hypothetical protein
MTNTDVSTSAIRAVVIFIRPERGIPTRNDGLGLVYRDNLLELARRNPLTADLARSEKYGRHWDYLAHQLLRARDQRGAKDFAVWSRVLLPLDESEVATLVAYAEKDREDQKAFEVSWRAEKRAYEVRWRAEGNRSRVVIDTDIKVGDRVRVSATHPMIEVLVPAVGRIAGGSLNSYDLYLPPSWEEVEARVLGFPETVTDIYYAGMFEGYVGNSRGEPFPTFNKWTEVSVECDLDGKIRRGHLDHVVRL